MTTAPPYPRLFALPEVQTWTRLICPADLDATSAGPLTSTMTQLWGPQTLMLEVDLSGVTSIDRDGLRPVVEAHARLGDRLRLFAPSQPVTELLHALGLNSMFTVVRPQALGPSRTDRPWSVAPPHGWAADDSGGFESSMPLPRALSDRATIEQAKGLLMGAHGCTAAAAWELLRNASRAHDTAIRVMARMLVEQAMSGLAPTSQTLLDDVMSELARSPHHSTAQDKPQ